VAPSSSIDPDSAARQPESPRAPLLLCLFKVHEDRLESLTSIVDGLGHEIVARGRSLADVGPLSRSSGAEVAFVGLGLDAAHALDQISAIVHEAACPVIALLDAKDPTYVSQAAQRGVFAYVVTDGEEPGDLQGALDITLRRFAEFQNLQGAFGRRAIIEQAKGILMERTGIDADAAFAVLRSHSQQTGQKLVDVAQAITQTHRLLPSTRPVDKRQPE
jgi:AmiR/NasT family two-component response regulator